MQKPNLKQIFLGLQKQMISELTTYRESILHPGAKGDACELNWIRWLGKYLPKRYQVDKASVIDCRGNISDEIDVVVYDQQYSPFVFHQNEAIYIPAESVYAVFEVKQELNKEFLEYAGKKAESVRTLHRTKGEVMTINGLARPKVHTPILAGILTLSCSWNEPFGDCFKKHISSLQALQKLDIGCVLESGAFKVVSGTEEPIISSRDEALIFFFLNFLAELQKIGTVCPMDISEYAKVLESF